jgi:hypothetical protein
VNAAQAQFDGEVKVKDEEIETDLHQQQPLFNPEEEDDISTATDDDNEGYRYLDEEADQKPDVDMYGEGEGKPKVQVTYKGYSIFGRTLNVMYASLAVAGLVTTD